MNEAIAVMSDGDHRFLHQRLMFENLLLFFCDEIAHTKHIEKHDRVPS